VDVGGWTGAVWEGVSTTCSMGRGVQADNQAGIVTAAISPHNQRYFRLSLPKRLNPDLQKPNKVYLKPKGFTVNQRGDDKPKGLP
jgi:hypothetical protein